MKSIAIALLTFFSAAYAANDWSTPCFNGVCYYESDTAALKIWGSVHAISDITPAGGWTILDCDQNALAQDIRVVCHDPSSCNHLYGGIGPVGKLIRLPENCGAGPFARLAKIWVHKDQSIPPSIAKTLRRRSATRRANNPQVQGVSLDTNFAAVDPQQSGNVSISVEGSNVPGATGNLTVTPSSQRRSRLSRRGVVDFVENAFDKFNNFDQTVTKQLPPIDVDKTFPIFEQSISCPASGNIPAFDASVKADVVTKAHAVLTLGVAASGTIVPPKLSQIGIFAGLDAQLDGTLELTGDATATADSGSITLFETGIPGLELPGIITLGPSFKILGQAKATLDIGVDMKVDLSYNINGAKLFFPSSQNHQSGGSFTPGDSPLKLSVTPSLSSKGVVEAHLIPTIELGISALNDAASANVFLNLDASASVTLTLDASAEADTQISPSANDTSAATDNSGTDSTSDSDPNTSTNSTSPTDGTDSQNSDDDNADSTTDQSDASADGSGDSQSDNADTTNQDGTDTSADDDGTQTDTTDQTDSTDDGTEDTDGPADDATNGQANDASNEDDTENDSGDTSGSDQTEDSSDTNDDTTGGTDASDDSDLFTTRDVSGSVNGCVDVGSSLSVNAGADASFFNLFDKDTTVPLFQKDFDLFKKCFGSGSATRRELAPAVIQRSLLRRGLTCPSANLANVASVADETVPASSIQAE